MRPWDKTKTLSGSLVRSAQNHGCIACASNQIVWSRRVPRHHHHHHHHQQQQLVPHAQPIHSPSWPTFRVPLLKSSVALDMCRVPAALNQVWWEPPSFTSHSREELGVAVDQLSTLRESKLVMENPWKIHGKSMENPWIPPSLVTFAWKNTSFLHVSTFCILLHWENMGNIILKRGKKSHAKARSCKARGVSRHQRVCPWFGMRVKMNWTTKNVVPHLPGEGL